jgi:hypothetical protein
VCLALQNTYILLCTETLCTHNTNVCAINPMLHVDSITFVCTDCFTAHSVNHITEFNLQEYLITIILLMCNNIYRFIIHVANRDTYNLSHRIRPNSPSCHVSIESDTIRPDMCRIRCCNVSCAHDTLELCVRHHESSCHKKKDTCLTKKRPTGP